MASKKQAKQSNRNLDYIFIFKIALYLVLSTQWLYIERASSFNIPIPVGALIALFLSFRDHFQIDRKIEYVVILLAMFVGFWLPIGWFYSI